MAPPAKTRTAKRSKANGKVTRKKKTNKKAGQRTAARTTTKRGTRESSPRRKAGLATVSTEALQAEFERRLEELQEKRDDLLAELDRLDREIAGFDRAGGPRTPKPRTGRRRPRNDTNLTEALHRLLTNKTMSVREMAEAVQKAGYRTTSPNFRTIVNQTLIANPKAFKRVARGKYTAV